MSDRSFSAALREKAAPIWRAELEHPFVRGLGDGTLPIDAFRFYMRQDYLFLIDYSRVFALAAAKARDLPTMGLFASLLHDTLHKEMGLHRDYCARLGIAADELEGTEAAQQTRAYTSHLLAVAYAEPLPSILAALLPCAWGYAEIGAELARRGAMREGSLYSEWVAMYSSAEFAAVANALRKLLDDLTAGWPAAELLPLERHFITSSRHEYLFWEMAWRQATWPI